MSTTKKAFRIEVAQPEQVKSIEQNASSDLKTHFNLIKKGLTQLPGVSVEAIYGAVTLRALALKPDIFSAWFLTEYHSVKKGEIGSKYKEILAYLISERNEGEFLKPALLTILLLQNLKEQPKQKSLQ